MFCALFLDYKLTEITVVVKVNDGDVNLLIFKPGPPGFLKLLLSMNVCACMCLCECVFVCVNVCVCVCAHLK